MKFTKGFTLIELLVVIAIIGILSSVVLASLTTARTRGQSAAVQSQLASMRSQAELYYSSTGTNTYGTAGTTCTTAGSLFVGNNSLAALLTGQVTGADCGNTDQTWSVAAPLPSGGAYCVDSTGVSRSTTAGGTAYTSATGGVTPAHASVGAAVCL